MALKKVARVGDTVDGHVDVQGNTVVGTVSTGDANTKNSTISIATTDCYISLPSHAHQLDGFGMPTDYRSHSWRIIGTGKHKANNKNIAVDGDGGNDADWDGYQTMPSQLSINATTTDLFCES